MHDGIGSADSMLAGNVAARERNWPVWEYLRESVREEGKAKDDADDLEATHNGDFGFARGWFWSGVDGAVATDC